MSESAQLSRAPAQTTRRCFPEKIWTATAGLFVVTIMPAATLVSNYGTLPDGRAVTCYTLTNPHGLRVTVLDYGAMLATVETPDRNGKLADVTLGFDDLAGWLHNSSYFGATVGRFANRIANGKFILAGKTYTLATNNTPNGIACSLHGGAAGFDQKMWTGRVVERPDACGIELSCVSPDGEEGYPGELTVKLTYWLTEKDELVMDFEATTDQLTVVNLTNHTYWNLTGNPTKAILGHEIMLAADEMLPVNAGLIPTGERRKVANTPFDFRQSRRVGDRIGDPDEQLELGNGYDHCWVLHPTTGLRLAARLHEPESGRVVELMSDQPGVQFYSGNFLDGTTKGKGGATYPFRTGLALEPQRFPDSPNQSTFPPPTLKPGEVYRQTILYRFSTQ